MTSNNEIHESKAMQEIDAIRLQIHNETRGLTIAQYTALVHKEAQAFLAEPIEKNLIGLSAKELTEQCF
ncbi:hypothetical protein AGMMS50233_10400 [Endomicrobiia bacterium]|nr:hypothetical protein AGMMS49990_06720 [Endomicrobiia bacterium]GHT57241.1 hypothetical protein AGMMS50233_10400 [Endomicrobiia bacterium]